jgi:hypothetical protein
LYRASRVDVAFERRHVLAASFDLGLQRYTGAVHAFIQTVERQTARTSRRDIGERDQPRPAGRRHCREPHARSARNEIRLVTREPGRRIYDNIVRPDFSRRSASISWLARVLGADGVGAPQVVVVSADFARRAGRARIHSAST